MENKPTPPKTQGLNFFGKHSELILGIAGTVILFAIIFYIVSVGSSQKVNDELINEQADWYGQGYQDGSNAPTVEEENILDRIYGETQEEPPVEGWDSPPGYLDYTPEDFPEFPAIQYSKEWGVPKAHWSEDANGFRSILHLYWGLDPLERGANVQKAKGALVQLNLQEPYGCEYEVTNKTWTAYPNTEDTDPFCIPEIKILNGVTAYGFPIRAPLAYAYLYSVVTKDGNYLFSISRHANIKQLVNDAEEFVFDKHNEQQIKESAEQDTLLFINANPELFLP